MYGTECSKWQFCCIVQIQQSFFVPVKLQINSVILLFCAEPDFRLNVSFHLQSCTTGPLSLKLNLNADGCFLFFRSRSRDRTQSFRWTFVTNWLFDQNTKYKQVVVVWTITGLSNTKHFNYLFFLRCQLFNDTVSLL